MESDFRVGDWLVHPDRDFIESSEKSIRLEPKAMDLLVYLTEHAGQVVSKERLIQAVWSDTSVADDVLTSAIWKLRQALGDDPKEPSFIQTIPRRGYSLIAPVTSEHTPRTESFRLLRRLQPLGWVLLAVTLLAVFGWYILRERAPSGIPGEITSIAVLSLENLSPDLENEYFADGMTEDITAALSKIGNLEVKGRTSAMRYKGSEKSLKEIAEELGVAALLEGSVRKAGERVRIVAQLIDAETGRHLWAETYDRDLSDVFEIQSDVAKQIATALKVGLAPAEKVKIEKRPTENIQAYNLYLMGRHLTNLETEESLKKAVAYYQQAIKEDPNFAEAYTGLACTYMQLRWQLGGEWTIEKVDEALKKSLELDDMNAFAYESLGTLQAYTYGDLANAETSYEKALRLDPANDYFHLTYGLCLFRRMGRLEEARAELNRAVELNPVSFDNRYFLIEFYVAAGEFDNAMQASREFLELYPGLGGGGRGYIYFALAEYDKAEQWANKSLEVHGTDREPILLFALISLCQGRMDRATEISQRRLPLKQSSPAAGIAWARAGVVALWAGDDEKARTFLEKAVQLWPSGYFRWWPTARWYSTVLGYILWKTGDRVEAEKMLSESLRLSDSERIGAGNARAKPSDLYDVSLVYAIRGEKAEAYRWLEKAIDAGWRYYDIASKEPIWADFHDEPRFQQMMAEVKARVDVMRTRVREMEKEWK